jgi:hypothetical protein
MTTPDVVEQGHAPDGGTLPDDPRPMQPRPVEAEPEEYFFTNPGQILDRDDQVWGSVKVPEWAPPGHPHPDRWALKLKGLSGRERDLFEASIQQGRGKSQKANYDNFRARLIVLCAVDPDGNKLFSRADIKRLGEKSSKALQRVFDECNRISGLSEEDVEELTEGFDDGPNGASTSG